MTEIRTLPPLVEAYLADLDRALTAADPRERAETLAAVREHVTESLALHGTDDDAVARVLADLGPVDAIAATATPLPGAPSPARGDGWLLVLAVAGLVGFWLPPLAIAALIWAIVRLRARTGTRSTQLAALWIAVASLAVAATAAAGLVAWTDLSPTCTGAVTQAGPGATTGATTTQTCD
ncbi:HAAS signaling domain-containing protein [Xylanimonas protaetiae]|uniref:Uncharacterized protein n=1 Tax=Xylanimonas protaetiae TaxID=2509457 RepID=A0A4P6F3K3_9MICO|nr:hypothetical protein [Xylanimonas protaetiae]QAY69253.1 hypothetical protein ET471_03695 [Xylanimonas protaetiae]